jgi:hypothetical protein
MMKNNLNAAGSETAEHANQNTSGPKFNYLIIKL